MKRHDLRLPIVVGLVLLIVQLPVVGASSSIGKVVPGLGTTSINGTSITLETTVFSGDTVATQARGFAVVMLPMGGKARLGSATSATFNSASNESTIVLNSGVTKVHAGAGQTVLVNALGLLVRSTEGSTFDVGIDGKSVLVAARTGNVEVVGMDSSLPIAAGNVMRFETVSKAKAMAAAKNGQQFIMTPMMSFWLALAIAAGSSIVVSHFIADNENDDLEEQIRAELRQACIDAINAVSPAASTAACG